jgi:hypothetical protein
LDLAATGKRRPSASTRFNSLAAATNSALVMVPKRRSNAAACCSCPGLCELQRADCASLLDQAAILWVVSQKKCAEVASSLVGLVLRNSKIIFLFFLHFFILKVHFFFIFFCFFLFFEHHFESCLVCHLALGVT